MCFNCFKSSKYQCKILCIRINYYILVMLFFRGQSICDCRTDLQATLNYSLINDAFYIHATHTSEQMNCALRLRFFKINLI